MSGAEAGHHASIPASLQGVSALLADRATRLDVLEKAFDFRGDVTLGLVDGSTITGYIFDRVIAPSETDSFVRLMLPDTGEKIKLAFTQITRVDFGKDTAAGKSFETWIKKYIEKKRAGEKASIESEAL